MNDLILRNMESVQYIHGAKKNFIMRNGITSESSSKVLIGHFSDIHGDIKRFENCLKYFDCFGVDFAIHTGDLVKWDLQDEYEFFSIADSRSKIPLYNCIGNHETFKGSYKTTNEELHKVLISKLKNINSPNNRGYYYVDFPEHKIRIIALNNYDYDAENAGKLRESYAISQEQCGWLIGVLKQSAKLGLGVIIFSHESDIVIPPASNDLGFCQRYEPYPWGIPKKHEHIIADIVDAFKHGKKIKKELTWESGLKVSINEEFPSKGEFICYLNGHRHGDYVGFLPEFPDQLSICMTCSGCFPEGYHNIGEEISDLPRIPDTVTEDAVNFYAIDHEKKMISIVRVGATVTDELKKRISLQIKYE